jgi:hypothetical protein
MGDGRIFLKTRRDASFNKDLSNEPTFRPDPSRWTVPLKGHCFLFGVTQPLNGVQVPAAVALPRGLSQPNVRLHGRVLARDTSQAASLQAGAQPVQRRHFISSFFLIPVFSFSLFRRWQAPLWYFTFQILQKKNL